MEKLLIPDKIRVGFQERNDTYTKKLAYVIYYDKKGKLRKETSWESWRSKKIDPVEFDNVPTEGFVLNKKVGGHKSSWNYRDSYVRVYDPRDFEFEISVPNLLYILTLSNSYKGKGLEGKFVYSWSGTDLVLLPSESEDYEKCVEFSNLQSKKVSSKDLITGATYETKRQEKITYLGRLNKPKIHIYQGKDFGKRHVFWNGKDFIFYRSLENLGRLVSDTICSDYADLIDKYNNIWSPPKRLYLQEKPKGNPTYYTRYFYDQSGDEFLQYIKNNNSYSYYNRYQSVSLLNKIKIIDGNLSCEYDGSVRYENNYYNNNSNTQKFLPKWVDDTDMDLWVELENGKKIKVKTSTYE